MHLRTTSKGRVGGVSECGGKRTGGGKKKGGIN